VFVKSVRAHLKAIRVLVESGRVLVYPVRVLLEALRLLQKHESVCRGLCDDNKSKRNHKHSNMEALDRNQPKLFDVFQLFSSKSKMFLFHPKP
jgi:hypothetical protein